VAPGGYFFDLPDYLTFRATGVAARSLCSTVCKWTYLGHEGRWDGDFLRAIGLGELVDEGFARIGTEILPIGAPIGQGLSDAAAAAFGLRAGIAVGVSAIDAHAGGIGVIGAALDGVAPDGAGLRARLALIGGTSSCHMAVAPEAAFIPGVWGPYFDAMIPGFWLNEGGQSATGALVDHVVTTHAAYGEVARRAEASGQTIYQVLNAVLDDLAGVDGVAMLTADLHVMPDFHGNRSPHADATLRGMISGLPLSASIEDCARLYLATIQGIAYGTRQIIETMNDQGYAIDTIWLTGGGSKNPGVSARACRCDVVPADVGRTKPEAVLLGAAILGSVAGRVYPDVRGAMAAMTRAGTVIEPDRGVRAYHDRKYRVFRRMHADQMAYRALMGS
jgi:Ribulose kinase